MECSPGKYEMIVKQCWPMSCLMYEVDNGVAKERKYDNEWKGSLEYFKTSNMPNFLRVRFKNVLFMSYSKD